MTFKRMQDAIDWTRLAKPQDDGYDVRVLSELDHARFGWMPSQPTSGVTLADGAVAVIAEPPVGMEMPSAVYADPSVATQEWADTQDAYLRAWSTGYAMVRTYLDEFWPFKADTGGRGCSSGHHVMTTQKPVHAVYVTINDPQGCAQGIYHEVAHSRLQSMGIYIEKHDGRLLANAPDELYDSSVRFDVKRPMSAVLHGLYAWLMFVENDYQLYKAGVSTADECLMYTLHNLPKIENGCNEVRRHARWTPEGVGFFGGMNDWADDLLDRCHAIAKENLTDEEYRRRCSSAR